MVSPRAGAFSARFLDQSHRNFQTMSLFLGEVWNCRARSDSWPRQGGAPDNRGDCPGRFDVKGDLRWKCSRPGRGERQEPIPRRIPCRVERQQVGRGGHCSFADGTWRPNDVDPNKGVGREAGESRETSAAEQLKAWRPGWPAAFRLFAEAAGTILTSRMPPIFRGLAPEESPRLVAAQALGVSPGNDFTLLDRLGGDVAGALQLLPEGELPPVFSPAFEVFARVR